MDDGDEGVDGESGRAGIETDVGVEGAGCTSLMLDNVIEVVDSNVLDSVNDGVGASTCFAISGSVVTVDGVKDGSATGGGVKSFMTYGGDSSVSDSGSGISASLIETDLGRLSEGVKSEISSGILGSAGLQWHMAVIYSVSVLGGLEGHTCAVV